MAKRCREFTARFSQSKCFLFLSLSCISYKALHFMLRIATPPFKYSELFNLIAFVVSILSYTSCSHSTTMYLAHKTNASCAPYHTHSFSACDTLIRSFRNKTKCVCFYFGVFFIVHRIASFDVCVCAFNIVNILQPNRNLRNAHLT